MENNEQKELLKKIELKTIELSRLYIVVNSKTNDKGIEEWYTNQYKNLEKSLKELRSVIRKVSEEKSNSI